MSSTALQSSEAVVRFWQDAGFQMWFKRDEAFDLEFRDRFLAAHHAAARRDLDGWSDAAESALALVLLLDQFPRNAFRGSAHAFATDPLARLVADGAIARRHDRVCAEVMRVFFYMPFEHSEAIEDQDRALALIKPLGGELERYAQVHRDVIVRFGRFPHRNPALGRLTTPAEQAFLDSGGFSA